MVDIVDGGPDSEESAVGDLEPGAGYPVNGEIAVIGPFDEAERFRALVD